MPTSKASAGRRKRRDAELSQLLKMALERLGNDDTDSSDRTSNNEDRGAKSSRPTRSHVAPHAAFPPVKSRNKGKAPASTPPKEASTLAVSPPEQVVLPEIPVPAVCTQPKPQGISGGAPMTPGLGVAEVLANIHKSLASLAPATVPGVPPTPVPAALPLGPPTPQVPKQHVQDPSRQALLEMSRLLASIKGQPVTPPPTAPWNSNDSLQHSLMELKHRVDALAAAHTSVPSQGASNSPSVTPTPSAVNTATPLLSNVLPEIIKVPGKDNSAKEGTTKALLSRPEKKPDLGISLIYYANKVLKAQHTYGGSAWVEYDRDFRWAKVKDPSIGWDQTEVNVWLECVNNKIPGRQPFRT
ncbi:hypothetical protein NDU88_003186 [Pleurodeles waltl]|uniref:Uncharacterized protein n=1 Tax=Pleurodeles waltl TaxID=8319 RepID=A0AAV7WQV5_PLEWA|nr:hypothetical protein NDU88_003186 [Pleurodeles waltl]